MNHLKLLKKYWLFLLIFAAVIFVIYVNSLPRPERPVTELPKPTPIPTSPITALPTLSTGFTPVNQIIWRLESLTLPEKLPALHISPPKSGADPYVPAAKAFGLNTTATKIGNLPIYVFNTSDGSADFYVNLKDRIAKYQLNLDLISLPQSGTRVTPADLQLQLTNQLTPILNLPTNFFLANGSTEYQVIDGERFTVVPSNDATFVQVTLDYQYNGLPIRYRGLPPVIAKYSIYGPLVSVSYALPPREIQPSLDYSLKTFSEIKQTPASQFEIITVAGNRAYTLSDQSEVIKTTTVTGGYLGYLMAPNTSVITPYVFFTGTSQSKTYGTLNVTLATPALSLPENPQTP